MKNDAKFTEDTPSEKKNGKGFYIALAVCLVAVCGVAVSGFVSSLSKTTPQTGTTGTAVRTTATTTGIQQVVVKATDVKDDRTTTRTTVTSAVPTTTTQAETWFVFPATNRVLLPFSDELIYSETLSEWGTHNGVDFEAKAGTQVKATAGGTVTGIYRDLLWGTVIEIDHGGKVVSRTCGVDAKNLTKGQTVQAGDVIGTVSEIPAESLTASHVHLEISANGKYVNPLLLIRGEAVFVENDTKE